MSIPIFWATIFGALYFIPAFSIYQSFLVNESVYSTLHILQTRQNGKWLKCNATMYDNGCDNSKLMGWV